MSILEGVHLKELTEFEVDMRHTFRISFSYTLHSHQIFARSWFCFGWKRMPIHTRTCTKRRFALNLLRNCLCRKCSQFFFGTWRRTNAINFLFRNFILLLEVNLKSDKVWHRIRRFNWFYFHCTDKKLERWKINQAYVFFSYRFLKALEY